jgi:hypothetical protein
MIGFEAYFYPEGAATLPARLADPYGKDVSFSPSLAVTPVTLLQSPYLLRS